MFPEEQFGLSDEFCSNIEDYRNTTAYDRVESEVRRSVGRVGVGTAQCAVVPQKVASELHPKVRNHGEGPY